MNFIAEQIKAVKIELKGPDNTLRVRQMKVLGIPTEVEGEHLIDRSSSVTALVAQCKCENETLRIFRLLSSEVFGKFLYGVKRGDNDAEGNDLQEHVVGILFSRNKLTHLQKQVRPWNNLKHLLPTTPNKIFVHVPETQFDGS